MVILVQPNEWPMLPCNFSKRSRDATGGVLHEFADKVGQMGGCLSQELKSF